MNTMIAYHPAREFRAFDSLVGRMLSEPSAMPMDVFEFEGVFTVRALVPGIEPSELSIKLEKGVLSIEGEFKNDLPAEAHAWRRETVGGKVSRALRLPKGLDLDRVNASFRNGVLTISIPRIPEEAPRTIEVKID